MVYLLLLFYHYKALKHSSFGLLLDIGLLVGYKGFSLISLGDKKGSPSPYVHVTCMARQASEVLVAYRRGWSNYSHLEYGQMPVL